MKSFLGHEESSFQALRRESGNTLIMYGKNIPKVKEMIRRNINSFRHEPRGPLGK